MRSAVKYFVILGCVLFFCVSCGHTLTSRTSSPQLSKVSSSEGRTGQLSADNPETSCDTDEGFQKFSFFISQKLELIVCAKVHQKISDTVFDVSEVKVYSRNPVQKKTDLITATVPKERRELLLNFDHRKVLLFEDIQTDKRLPLFSQEITCASGECFTKNKICLFKQDPDIHTEGIESLEDVKKLLQSPEGQVKVLLAALSGFEPAIEAYSNREPQALDPQAHESFVLRKRQFEQARSLCKTPSLK